MTEWHGFIRSVRRTDPTCAILRMTRLCFYVRNTTYARRYTNDKWPMTDFDNLTIYQFNNDSFIHLISSHPPSNWIQYNLMYLINKIISINKLLSYSFLLKLCLAMKWVLQISEGNLCLASLQRRRCLAPRKGNALLTETLSCSPMGKCLADFQRKSMPCFLAEPWPI